MLKTDERFLTNALRLSNRTELCDYLLKAINGMPYDILRELCKNKKVTIAPINDLKAVFGMPEAQDLILTETLSDGRVMRSVKTAVFKIV